MLSRSIGMPSRKNGPPSIWDTHGISGNVFANPAASSSAPYPQELNPWSISEHTLPHVRSENQTPVQDLRCQSGPSARNSVIPSEGDSSKNYGADQQRLQISDLHFDKFSTPATFTCWKIRFITEVCTCSQLPTEAMLWVGCFRGWSQTCFVRGIQIWWCRSVRNVPSHVPCQPALLPPCPDLGGMLNREDKPPDIWDTGFSGNVFVNPPASSSSPYPGGFNPWSPNVTEHITTCNEWPSKHQTQPWIRDASQDRQPEIQSSLVSERFFKELWGRPTTTADFGSSFWQVPHVSNLCLLEDKVQDWGMYLFTIPYGSYAVDQRSGTVWFSGWSKIFVFCKRNSNARFEVLDAKIASTLNSIIHNTQFKRNVSLEEQTVQKENRFLRGRQIAYLIYEYFRVTGANDSVENYADLFTVVLRNDDIQEFDSKWDGILLSMTKIPSDDISEGLYKLRMRESEKLKTVLELYNLEIHQKKAGPDYHSLKTMVKRSIEQNLRIKNFEANNGNYERNAVVKNQGTKQRGQWTLGDCWHWKADGQCSKGDNCSFRHDINKRAKLTQPNPSTSSSTRQHERNASRTRSPRGKGPSGRMSRWPCKDYLKGTCANSFCEKWHPPDCLSYKTKSGFRFG